MKKIFIFLFIVSVVFPSCAREGRIYSENEIRNVNGYAVDTYGRPINGTVKVRGTNLNFSFKDGRLKKGESRTYFPSGQKETELQMDENGDGYGKVYYQSGAVQAELWPKGFFNGTFKTYYQSGALESKGHYALDTKGHYSNLEISGKYQEYYPNGILKRSCEMQNGKCEGNVQGNSEDGKIGIDVIVHNGEFISATLYDKKNPNIKRHLNKSQIRRMLNER